MTDSTGAVIPKATITALNVDTNIVTKTTSTKSGDYTIPYLKVGNYTLSIEEKGFETAVHTGINLQVDQTATVNFTLKVGSSSETVTVNSDPLIDFGKADAGEVVENTRVAELPLNGRDPGMLSILSAGVTWNQGATQYQRPFDDTQANTAINGGGSGNVELMLDGVSNEAASTNNTGNARIAYVPPVDSVQEFKIVTNAYDARFGRNSGGVEDVILKSGTNLIHGDVYEYARRTFLDANLWQNNYKIATALPGTDTSQFGTQKHKLDQYGFELDGPIVIPKLYNGRDKSFFTMQYENWNEVEPNTVTDSVPSPAWLKGDFTNLVYYTGSSYAPISLLDPQNISQNANGTYVRVPFGPTDAINPTPAANVIPASRINAVAQKILSYYPAPNTQTAAGSNPFANNYTVAAADTDRYRNVLGKWDENISSKDRFSFHYGYWERVERRSYVGFSNAADNGQLPHGERSHTFTLEETHTVSPNLLLDFRSNVSIRADYSFGGPRFDPTTLGLSSADLAGMGPAAAVEFPYIQVSEFASLGTNNNSQTVSNSLLLFPSVTWVKNKQTIHAGVDARFQQSGNNIVGGGNSLYVDRQWTQTNCCGPYDVASGNSIASLLLGNLTSGSNTINVKTFFSSHYWAPFVQDDWKVTRKLTLNLGVRWDFAPAQTERNNFANYAFNTTATNPINSQVTVPGHGQLLGGITYLGVNGNPRAPFALTKGNVQPRVGFAYALNDRMVLRGGFGESFRSQQAAPSTYGFSATTNYQASDPTRPSTSYPNLANPISHLYPSVIQPTGSSLGMLEQLGQSPFFLNPHYKIPSFWTYSLGIEQQFRRNDTISIAYVGSRLYNGDSSDNINHQSAAAYAPCNPALGGRYEVCTNNNPINPFQGINGFQGSNYYNSTTISQLNFTRSFPQFGDITEYQLNNERTWYNSLQVTAAHKWNKSLTMHGTWTWSKQMDAGGFADTTYRVPSRSLDGNDRTHRITLSGVYLLPVGRGRTFLGSTNRIVDGVIGGWEIGSLYVYQTGTPWAIPAGTNILASPYVHPHIQKDNGFIRLVSPCTEKYQENNSGAYPLVQVPVDYDGTCSQANFLQVPNYGETQNTTYTGIRLPRSHQFDTNLSKNFALFERLSLQIRLEAFNVLNHPLWSENPDNNTNDSTFGLIEKGAGAGQSNLPRQMQLSAKISW
ncbi:TonB-dependent receptor [Granulicella arctica]|uniref:TonB-dependent receptor n=1 Tax=Granulicella arctica TaxID=940613 RepID=UPI0021E03B95|nr:TonB-dependent receptor [Granulicella arctica]